MVSYIIKWVISSACFYVSLLALYFLAVFNIMDENGIIVIILFLISIISLMLSTITYHPKYKQILVVAKKMFFCEFLFKYIVFVCFMFAYNYNLNTLFYSIYSVGIAIEIFLKLKIIKNIYNCNQTIFSKVGFFRKDDFKKVFFEKKVRTLLQIITIILLVVLIILRDTNVFFIKDWIMMLLTFVIMPTVWGVGEFIDYILNKKLNK